MRFTLVIFNTYVRYFLTFLFFEMSLSYAYFLANLFSLFFSSFNISQVSLAMSPSVIFQEVFNA